MATLPVQIIELLGKTPGLTDREVTIALRGLGAAQQPINQAARALGTKGLVTRKKRSDGLIGNYLSGTAGLNKASNTTRAKNHDFEALSEDEIKQVIVDWLSDKGWESTVAWGREPGIDIEAKRDNERWIIEVKGPGSRPQMRVNYFLAILGETLQRMGDSKARYSISLPDLPQYRGLWERLPKLAKSRTKVSVLFVSRTGDVDFVE